MPEATLSRHAPVVAGLIHARRKEQDSRWTLLNEAVAILRQAELRAGEALTAVTLDEALPDEGCLTGEEPPDRGRFQSVNST